MLWPFHELHKIPLDQLDTKLDAYAFVFATGLNLNALVMTTITIFFVWPNSLRYGVLNVVLISSEKSPSFFILCIYLSRLFF